MDSQQVQLRKRYQTASTGIVILVTRRMPGFAAETRLTKMCLEISLKTTSSHSAYLKQH